MKHKPAQAHEATKPAAEEPAAPATIGAPAQAPTQDRETELLQQLQRLQAEFENYRKRANAETAAGSERGQEKAIKDLLPVFDSFALAKAHSTADAAEIAKGIKLIHSQLAGLMESWGVSTIPSDGIVDPRLHEVYLTETLKDKPAGTILQTLQPGYVRNGTVLRTAKVKAARN